MSKYYRILRLNARLKDDDFFTDLALRPVEVDEPEDTKRLEQIFKDGAQVIQSGERGWAYQKAGFYQPIYGKTPREAIDAAMRKDVTPPKP